MQGLGLSVWPFSICCNVVCIWQIQQRSLHHVTMKKLKSDKQTDLKVAQKLVDIINKPWGSKLEEAKLKEKLVK